MGAPSGSAKDRRLSTLDSMPKFSCIRFKFRVSDSAHMFNLTGTRFFELIFKTEQVWLRVLLHLADYQARYDMPKRSVTKKLIDWSTITRVYVSKHIIRCAVKLAPPNARSTHSQSSNREYQFGRQVSMVYCLDLPVL